MKKVLLLLGIILSMLTVTVSAQDCSIISKANDITPDRLCSPVTVNWDVSFRGVNDGGATVQIKYDWDDGTVEIYDAVNTDPSPAVREWAFKAGHTYTSEKDKCNYHPRATLIVNGQECTSSSQEQIVTVWDVDDSNGGELIINPDVYPICFGNSADVRFQDVTLFNCIPPQENDVPNVNTRWIQWVYGTDITMTGAPVTINGNPESFPYFGSVKTLPGPVTGSGIYSEIMNVADDKLVGQYFEVTLRYWNYCNPYDDPLIPGPPADTLNGDNNPVTTTAIILIVPYPDAEITPVNPVCISDDDFSFTAADAGGQWRGNGIIDSLAGVFSPSRAGVGNHLIRYEITDGNACSDWDTLVVRVLPAPDVRIEPVPSLCNYNEVVDLESNINPGTWSGTGITNPASGFFDPALAGTGIHQVTFLSEPDVNGCSGKDTVEITVNSPPGASFLTNDTSWCETADSRSFALIEIDGTNDLDYDLIWLKNGEQDTIYSISNDSLLTELNNKSGTNRYRLLKVVENFGANSCESDLNDDLTIRVLPAPEMELFIDTEGVCSPVNAYISTTKGNKYGYDWTFGDGTYFSGDSSFIGHTFYNFGTEDTTYHIELVVETPNGCTDSISSDITVYPTPRADFFVSPTVQDYPSTEVILSNFSGEGSWNYLWDFGDGDSSRVRDPGGHNYDNYGDYSISLKTYSEYCADSITRIIRILPPAPEASFTPDTSGCSPLRVKFKNNSLYGETYLWDFDDGTFSNEKEPVHTFYTSRDYEVKLLVSGLSGSSQAERIIRVYPFPDAEFHAYPDSAVRTDQVFKFLNNSEGAVRYEWDFGDGSVSTQKDPSYIYNKEGIFDISLYVWNEHGCPDTLIRDRYIRVEAREGEIKFPNVFRWNRSGPTGGYWTTGTIDNTVFHPVFENVVEYELLIYSRWGELLYRSDDVYKGWDGYLRDGRKAPQGAYVYKAILIYGDGSREIKMGDVTFLH